MKVIVTKQKVSNARVKSHRPIIKRYPSFSGAKCSVPSHKVKARPTVKPRPIICYPYPNFDHVKHKIDDVNTLPKVVVQPRERTFDRLPSFSHVSTTIPKKRKGGLARARNIIRKLNGMCRTFISSGHENSSREEQKYIHSTPQITDVLADNDDYIVGETSMSIEGAADPSESSRFDRKAHWLSELQRKRIALVFEAGSRLLRAPFPFLIVYAYAGQSGTTFLREKP